MARLRVLRGLLAFLIATFCVCSAQERTGGTSDKAELRALHLKVLNTLNTRNSAGKLPELDDPEVRPLLYRGWDLAGQWAARYIEAHPSASALQLQRIFRGFAPEPQGIKSKYGDFLEYIDYWFSGDAVRITPSVYVVHASYGTDFPTGTFMVVARGPDGHFHASWSIKPIAERHYASRDEIGRWAHLVRRAYYTGPLNVRKVYRLSPAADGSPRFMVDAVQNADGGTILNQLSIWKWTGTEAQPLLIGIYEYAADRFDFQFDGHIVRIATKEDLESFSSCGGCVEPLGTWTIRINPNGVEDLGHRFQKPELKWTDELLTRVEKGQDSSDIASEKVVRALTTFIKASATEDADEGVSWGMLDSCHILSRGNRGEFDVNLDEAHLTLKYVRRGGKPYFTDIRIR